MAVTAQAEADEDACPPPMAAWLDRCATQSGLSLRVRRCPPGRVVIAVAPPEGARFDVEVRASGEGSFRSVAGFGLSPVGEFHDWSKETKARRDAFDAVARCVRDSPSLPLAAPPIARTDAEPPVVRTDAEPPSRPARRIPWLLLGGLLAVLASWWIRRRASRAHEQQRSASDPATAVGLPALAVACFAYRWFALPRGFFHQNGQGPMWIRQAVEQSAGVSDYGPGYAEVFGWLARAFPDTPDTAVFAALAAVSACIPPMAWWLARRSGAHPLAAWALAVLFAVHPLVGRLAQSESYFAIGLLLLFSAACVLSTTGTRTRPRSPAVWLGVLASGLFLAQAVRIHPVLWAPACAVPAVLLVAPGRWRRRLLQTLLAGFGIAVVVVATSGTTLWSTLAGLRSHPLQPIERLTVPLPSAIGWIALLALAAVAVITRDRVRSLLAVGVIACGYLSIRATDVLEANYPVISHAYPLLWAAPFLAAGLSLLQAVALRAPRRRAVFQSAIVMLAGALVTVPWWSDYFREPTDLREQSWALEWRTRLEPNVSTAYLGRSGSRILNLPLYRHNAIIMRSGELPPPLPEAGASLYYYRSSLCSTEEGMTACADFERGLHLVPIEERDLPGLGSHPWQPLGPGVVRVGLYRVEPAR